MWGIAVTLQPWSVIDVISHFDHPCKITGSIETNIYRNDVYEILVSSWTDKKHGHLCSDWLKLKTSSPLHLLDKLELSFAGMLFVRSSTKLLHLVLIQQKYGQHEQFLFWLAENKKKIYSSEIINTNVTYHKWCLWDFLNRSIISSWSSNSMAAKQVKWVISFALGSMKSPFRHSFSHPVSIWKSVFFSSSSCFSSILSYAGFDSLFYSKLVDYIFS